MIVANKSLKTQKTYWVVGFSAFWFLRLSGYFKMFVANLKKKDFQDGCLILNGIGILNFERTILLLFCEWNIISIISYFIFISYRSGGFIAHSVLYNYFNFRVSLLGRCFQTFLEFFFFA